MDTVVFSCVSLERLRGLVELGGGLNFLFLLFLTTPSSSNFLDEFSVDSSLVKGIYLDGGFGVKMSEKNLGVKFVTRGKTVVLVNLSACSNIFPRLCGIT